jgi:hypothetical protein
MDFSVSPALLGGIMITVALSAWTLGRWQGGAAPTQPPLTARLSAMPVSPHQPQARAVLPSALGQGDSLSDLHAEVCAYRRQEQIFASLTADAFWSDRLSVEAKPAMRRKPASVQPSPDCASLTRV